VVRRILSSLSGATQAELTDRLGQCKRGLSDYERAEQLFREAIVHYGEALRINPAYAEARLGLDRLTSRAERLKRP
jgi:hypothetical protein